MEGDDQKNDEDVNLDENESGMDTKRTGLSNASPSKEKEPKTFTRQSPAPFIYAAQFNNKQDIIMAGGAGANQVRLYDYDTGHVLCIISDMSRAVLCLTNANTTNDFCFGSCDSKLRIMSLKNTN